MYILHFWIFRVVCRCRNNRQNDEDNANDDRRKSNRRREAQKELPDDGIKFSLNSILSRIVATTHMCCCCCCCAFVSTIDVMHTKVVWSDYVKYEAISCAASVNWHAQPIDWESTNWWKKQFSNRHWHSGLTELLWHTFFSTIMLL